MIRRVGTGLDERDHVNRQHRREITWILRTLADWTLYFRRVIYVGADPSQAKTGGKRYGCAATLLRFFPLAAFESRRRARDEKRDAVCGPPCNCFLSRVIIARPERGCRAAEHHQARALQLLSQQGRNLFECWALGQERVDGFIAETNARRGSASSSCGNWCTPMAKPWRPTPAPAWFGSTSVTSPRRTGRSTRRQEEHRPDVSEVIADGIADRSIKPCDPR